MFEYIKHHYKCNPEIGQRIIMRGKPGTIISDEGPFLGVNFDHDHPSVKSHVHPLLDIIYTEEFATPRRQSNPSKAE